MGARHGGRRAEPWRDAVGSVQRRFHMDQGHPGGNGANGEPGQYVAYTGNALEFGSGATFPQVLCDDKKLGGCTDTIKFLKEKQIV